MWHKSMIEKFLEKQDFSNEQNAWIRARMESAITEFGRDDDTFSAAALGSVFGSLEIAEKFKEAWERDPDIMGAFFYPDNNVRIVIFED